MESGSGGRKSGIMRVFPIERPQSRAENREAEGSLGDLKRGVLQMEENLSNVPSQARAKGMEREGDRTSEETSFASPS